MVINPPGLAPLVDAVDQRRHTGIFTPTTTGAWFLLYTHAFIVIDPI